MKCRAEGHKEDGKLRHAADAYAWKHFDNKFVKFASDRQNDMLYLTSNRFICFGKRSTQYNICPVTLMNYNLLLWLCMK